MPRRYLEAIWKPYPDPSSWGWFDGDPGERLSTILSFGDRITDLAVTAPEAIGQARVGLSSSAPSWLTSVTGRAVPLLAGLSSSAGPTMVLSGSTSASSANSVVAPLPPESSGAMPYSPDLLWLERGGSTRETRWAALSASYAGGASMMYETSASGSLGVALSASAQLIPEASGSGAAIVDTQTGALFFYEPRIGFIRARNDLPTEARRTGAALLLTGASLHVMSGSTGGTLSTTGIVLDVTTGSTLRQFGGLPARRDARLFLTQDLRDLLFVGGVDNSNSQHDDVWAILPGSSDLPSVRKIHADTGRSFNLAATFFAGRADGAVTAFEIDSSSAHVGGSRRTEAGWTPAHASGSSPAASCSEGDVMGLALCSASQAASLPWWSLLGRTPCEADNNTQACRGEGGSLVWSAVVDGPSSPSSLAVDERTIWSSRGKKVSRWIASRDLPPWSAGQVGLTQDVTEVAANGGEALVLSRDGVRVVRGTGNAISASSATGLCGRPLHGAPIGSGTWLVLTTTGVSVVSTQGPGAPVWTAMYSLIAHGPAAPTSGELVSLPMTSAMKHMCAQVDSVLPAAVFSQLRELTRLATDGSETIAVSWPGFVFGLDFQNASSPSLRGVAFVPGSLTNLRVDHVSGRAYGTLDSGPPAHRRPVIDLRGDVKVIGSHNIAPFLPRSERSELVARKTAVGLEIAWREP